VGRRKTGSRYRVRANPAVLISRFRMTRTVPEPMLASAVADIVGFASSQGFRLQWSLLHATRQFAVASLGRTLPMRASMPLSPTYGMSASSRRGVAFPD